MHSSVIHLEQGQDWLFFSHWKLRKGNKEIYDQIACEMKKRFSFSSQNHLGREMQHVQCGINTILDVSKKSSKE